MKNIIMLVASFVIACFGKAETSVTTSVWSEYVSSHSAVFSDKPVFQTAVSQSFENGTYVSLFHSVGIDDTSLSSDYGDEIDYAIGWVGGKKTTIEVKAAYWDLFDLFESSKRDIYVASVCLSHKIASGPFKGTVGLKLDSYNPADPSFWKHGCRGFAFYAFKAKMTNTATFGGQIQLVRDDGALRSNPSFVLGLAGGLNWKIGKVTLTFPQVKQTYVLTHVRDGRKNQRAWGSSASVSF